MSMKNVKIYSKTNLDLPKYETVQSAGLDIKANINLESISNIIGCKFVIDHEDDNTPYISLLPQGRVTVPTGLFIEIMDEFTEFQIRPRSGLSAKYGITVLNAPGTIDADYRGEIKVILYNTNDTPFKISHGDRIAQGVLNTINKIVWEQVDDITGLSNTNRGSGGFGHTGKN